MRQYLRLLKHIKENGIPKDDRTGTGTLSVFGYQMRFYLERGLPLVTTKKVHVPSVIRELLWFLRGEGNIQYLIDHNVTIWDEWAKPDGSVGPMYGVQWRSWPAYDIDFRCIDQLDNVIKEIQNNPNSRRLIVSAWNVAELDEMALNPCHVLFQFYVVEGRLSCQVYIRSSDVFLGLPFDIASYALLTAMVAQVCDLHVGELIVTLGDAHIYSNHMEQVELQLQRVPRPLPILYLNDQVKAIDDFKYEDFYIEGYDPHPAIKAPVAV